MFHSTTTQPRVRSDMQKASNSSPERHRKEGLLMRKQIRSLYKAGFRAAGRGFISVDNPPIRYRGIMVVVCVHGVQRCLRTAATNGPIVRLPGDI
jgi:hypothetical protein